MSGSAAAFSSLDPNNLPTDPTSLDIWILRDQNIILSTHIISETSMNLKFAGFIKNILTTFGQVITIETQPFHQALVLRDKSFMFERMDSNIKYAAKTNKRVSQIATLFQQIVTQELSFLSQLQAFTKMLIDANIFTTQPSVQSITPGVKRRKRSIAQFNLSNESCHNCVEKMSNGFHKILQSTRNKRNIFDIFTPYSVNELGATANQNYQLVNRNFANVHITEKKLTHAQNQLHENFVSLDAKEKALLQKELYLELRSLRSTHYSDFLFDLKEILKTNHLDKSYAIIFELLRNEEFCFESRCYSLPIFSVLEDNVIQITVEMSSQQLSKAEYISCTILPNARTSAYSHQLAILKNDKLHFKSDELPSISFLQLKDPKIDAQTRPISPEDMMEDIFYPIYSNEKVSLQCILPKHVEIDGEMRYCDQNSLEFGPFPKEVRVSGVTVLSMHIPSHFSQKLAWVNEDFSSIMTFKEKNSTVTPFVRDVIGFFETAQPVHYSLMATTCLVLLVLTILCCCAIYMNCPSLLAKLLCCCNNRCDFKQRVRNRVEYCENAQLPPTVANSRSRDQPVSGPSQDPDIETSFMLDQINPESQTMDQVRPIIKHQAPSVGLHSSHCARGYRGCSCLRDKYQCYGPQGQPPAYGQLTN
jgi:hypothetical protein